MEEMSYQRKAKERKKERTTTTTTHPRTSHQHVDTSFNHATTTRQPRTIVQQS